METPPRWLLGVKTPSQIAVCQRTVVAVAREHFLAFSLGTKNEEELLQATGNKGRWKAISNCNLLRFAKKRRTFLGRWSEKKFLCVFGKAVPPLIYSPSFMLTWLLNKIGPPKPRRRYHFPFSSRAVIALSLLVTGTMGFSLPIFQASSRENFVEKHSPARSIVGAMMTRRARKMWPH